MIIKHKSSRMISIALIIIGVQHSRLNAIMLIPLLIKEAYILTKDDHPSIVAIETQMSHLENQLQEKNNRNYEEIQTDFIHLYNLVEIARNIVFFSKFDQDNYKTLLLPKFKYLTQTVANFIPLNDHLEFITNFDKQIQDRLKQIEKNKHKIYKKKLATIFF